MIESGKKEGARLVSGGEALGGDGYFIKPTVFAEVCGSLGNFRLFNLGF